MAVERRAGAEPQAAAPLARLRGRGVRNLEPFALELGCSANLVLGPNGAGKTSLIEAAYLVATTRSFRTARLGEVVREGASALSVEAEIQTAARTRLSVAWSEEGGLDRAVNGNETPLLEHLRVVAPIIWWSGLAEIFTGGPAERRRFLDQGVVAQSPQAMAILGRYRRSLRQKRELLTVGGAGLEAWNRVLAEGAAEVIRLRARHVEALRRELEGVMVQEGGSPDAVELIYHPSPAVGIDGVEAVERRLGELARREREQAQPLVGPHRDNLEIRWRGRSSGAGASAGEQQRLGLALTEARARMVESEGRAAIMLLDDADSGLDAAAQERLIGRLEDGRQSLVTSSREDVWRGLSGARRWRLDQGVVEAL